MSLARITLIIATIGAGLSAGFFFTYEASVTLGLAEVSDVAYVETFQAINDTIRNPWFGSAFFGTIPFIGVALLLNWRASAASRLLIAAAAVTYLVVGAITALGNVPLNDDLAEVTSVGPAVAERARADFEDEWNQLNLLRTLSAVASFALLVVATALSSGSDVPSARGATPGASGSSRSGGPPAPP